jgi:uncharacterized protein YndB with AHSA1/START domain
MVEQPDVAVDESIRIAAPAHEVWLAIVDAKRRAGWWEYLKLDATVGGRFEERWADGDGREQLTSGVVVEAITDQLLVLRWADEGWPATTDVELWLSETSGTTSVRLRHFGWERIPDGAALAEEHRTGWRRHLDHLRRHVERAGRCLS